jgi:hypothetical protein
LAAKYWEVKMYPEEGSTTQSITLLVRMVDTETTGTTPRYVYVFYDGVLIIKASTSTYSSTTKLYTYRWDLAFTVPQTSEATAYGDHVVTVRLEDYDGSYSEDELEYTITEGTPKDTAIDYEKLWQNVPEEFFAKIWEYIPATILATMKGETGAKGQDGKDATINYAELGDQIDYAALAEEIPASKFRGETGATGAAGKDADSTLLYICLALSLVANVAWILPRFKKKA